VEPWKLSNNPRRRSDLLDCEVAHEVLVYDGSVDTAHSLAREAATVWRLFDGTRSTDDIAAEAETLGITQEKAHQALSELSGANLLDNDEAACPARRGLLRRVAVGIAATPLVMSALAPSPADAASTVNRINVSDPKSRGEDDESGFGAAPLLGGPAAAAIRRRKGTPLGVLGKTVGKASDGD
jgi:hypothetical protein